MYISTAVKKEPFIAGQCVWVGGWGEMESCGGLKRDQRVRMFTPVYGDVGVAYWYRHVRRLIWDLF